MIDTTLRATSEKLCPGATRIFGGPRNSSAQKAAKKSSIAARPAACRRSPRAASRAVFADRQAVRRHRRNGCRGGRAARSSSASESAAWADRPAPPDRSRSARSRWHSAGRPQASRRRERGGGQPLGRQALHRVAVDRPMVAGMCMVRSGLRLPGRLNSAVAEIRHVQLANRATDFEMRGRGRPISAA